MTVMGNGSWVMRLARRATSHAPRDLAATGRAPRITSHESRVTSHFLPCIALVLALAGCAGKPSSQTHYYALSVEAAPSGPGEATPVAPVARVAVTRVGIPGVVDRPQIVSRTATNSVEIHDFHRWAEPLQEAIARVIAGDLARQLGPGHAVSANILPGMPPDVRVAVDVQKFEATPGTGVAVEALWTVRPGAGEARVGRSTVEEPATEGGHAGIAAAYSRALAAVARDIAAAISAAAVPPKK